ncbi:MULTISPECIES: hypothetical protein [Providencia]|uniref:Bbp19 family protein n=1 Tax=Providencia TaxID=586 RepID=UPI00197E59F9|nr:MULTISPECIES: hypothetical protein [Providencia]MBN4863291.1 hypothetical protein [Providencia stuartii]MBN4876450.1 hypothetical protein [Providencia stuartii]MBN4878266.1 hypothetical protein [Providencia stuartii]MBN4881814.1 hypothetical protein [Providencia stuartii]
MTQLDDYTEEEKVAIQADLELKAKQRKEREDDDLKQVMSTEYGRRFIWKTLSASGVFEVSFTSDPYITSFNEGRRNKGLELFNDVMSVCPDLYLVMAEEAKEQENNQ